MTSKQTCYVWKWLISHVDPIVAGVINVEENGEMSFRYGRSYLSRKDKEPIYDEELPLVDKTLFAKDLELRNFSSIRDAAPDAWGRRVIHSKLDISLEDELTEIMYLLNSSSDRIGSIDFQESAKTYIARGDEQATMRELQTASEMIAAGMKLPVELDKALLHGTSLGGARPKAMIVDGNFKYIAKFSASNDTYNIVKSEFISMKLARLCGINVSDVKIINTAGKDALLVKRFDRTASGNDWLRHSMISGLTVLGLDEGQAMYCTYPDLIAKMQILCKSFSEDAKELYRRIVFNVLIGNTDDHARNHAFFVVGKKLILTPAYDICPQSRTGGEARHGMYITNESNTSTITNCLNAAAIFHVEDIEAKQIVSEQITVINDNFELLCKEVELPYQSKKMLWRRAILNDYAFYGNDDLLRLRTYELVE